MHSEEFKLSLHNTLSGRVDHFIPIDKEHIKMYVCGPTVYSRPHIGNMRAVVVYDLLYRLLSVLYKKVTYVRNITDVDDKIMQAAEDRGIEINEVTKEVTAQFHEDINTLFCFSPNHEPRATEYIPQMITMIERLINNGHAYASGKHVLFSVDTFKNYGKLSKRSVKEMIAGARVEVADYKKNPMDFVLWKPSTPAEVGWDSTWGYGRPGWHIECSAMSSQLLGNNFDIHGGGVDLQFPHHENEIAQSCCANPGSHFARFWVHNGFLTFDGEKMSKSLGNIMTVKDLQEKGIHPEVIRYVLLFTNYHKPIDFNHKIITDASNFISNIYRLLFKISYSNPDKPLLCKALDKADVQKLALENLEKSEDLKEVVMALCDNLNTSKYTALLHKILTRTREFVKNGENEKAVESAISLRICCWFMSIVQGDVKEWVNTSNEIVINSDSIEADKAEAVKQYNLDESAVKLIDQAALLAEQRQEYKVVKDFASADKLRDEIIELGFEIIDLSWDSFMLKRSVENKQ